MTTLTHPTLIDPATGEPLEAIGIRASGAPIWPMIGASLDKIGLPDGVDDTDDDEDDSDDNSSDDADKPKDDGDKGGDTKPKGKTEDKDDDPGDSDDDGDDGEPWDEERARKAIAKRNRENKALREKLANNGLTKAEREELEKLRDEKRTEKEKLEHRANSSEKTVSQLQRELEETKIRLAIGIPLPDDDSDDEDPFGDIPLKGDTPEERLASAKKFAEKYGIGHYAKKDDPPADPKQRKTPPATKLKGSRGVEDDDEDDPMKLAAKVKSTNFGLN